MLTGEQRILRADILFDCGRSMNPALDMGQVGVAPPLPCGQSQLRDEHMNHLLHYPMGMQQLTPLLESVSSVSIVLLLVCSAPHRRILSV